MRPGTPDPYTPRTKPWRATLALQTCQVFGGDDVTASLRRRGGDIIAVTGMAAAVAPTWKEGEDARARYGAGGGW